MFRIIRLKFIQIPKLEIEKQLKVFLRYKKLSIIKTHFKFILEMQ